MSNVNSPHGFGYVTINKPFPARTRVFDHLAADGDAIFQNDVVWANSGVSGEDAPPVQTFAEGATPGETIPLGVALNYAPASTLYQVHVNVDLDSEYEAQDNNANGTGIVATNMGKNANVDPTGVAGSTLTGFSGHQINTTGIAVTGTLDMHLLRRYPDVLNSFGPYCRILIKFNEMREATQTAGV